MFSLNIYPNMQDELTADMHEEFWISPETEKSVRAFAAFQGVSDKMSLAEVLNFLDMSIDDVRPFVAEWNQISTKQIYIE